MPKGATDEIGPQAPLPAALRLGPVHLTVSDAGGG